MSTTALPSFDALYFDGKQPLAQPVTVDVLGSQLLVWTAQRRLLHRVAVAQATLSEPFAHAPRLIDLGGGARVQVADSAGITAALGHAGWPPPLVARLQQRWPVALLALATLLALLAFGYLRGLPAAARWAAFALPPQIEQQLGDQVLELLDAQQLRPSQLDPAHQQRLRQRFAEMAQRAAPGVAHRLEFRTIETPANEQTPREGRDPSPRGINAFALPGGTIVMLDGLVLAAPGDDEVLAVLGHELGHVAHKHGMTHLIRAVGIGSVASLLWGDFAGAAANAPVLLGVLKYSRDAEREADAFAVDFLRASGLGVEPLLGFFDFVDKLQKKHGGAPPDFLSTHPATPERIERLRAERAATP
jgi:predicted Zn-dependent protease